MPFSNFLFFFGYIVYNVSWSHWWDGARITSSEIRASLLLIFVLVSFLCMYHFSLLSEVFGFFVFPSYGHQVLGNIFCFPFWFMTLPFGFQTTSDLHFYHSFHRMSTLVLVFNGSLSSIPQGLCITFRSLFSTPCSQINLPC